MTRTTGAPSPGRGEALESGPGLGAGRRGPGGAGGRAARARRGEAAHTDGDPQDPKLDLTPS